MAQLYNTSSSAQKCYNGDKADDKYSVLPKIGVNVSVKDLPVIAVGGSASFRTLRLKQV